MVTSKRPEYNDIRPWKPAETTMRAKAPVALTQAHHYRETAKSLRERAHALKFSEARDELQALAAEYERLADFAQAIKAAKTRRPH